MKNYIKKILELKTSDLNMKVSAEDLRSVVYFVYIFAVFLTPIIPETVGYGLYSLKNTLTVLLTFFSAATLVAIDIKQRKKIKLNIFEILLIIYIVLVFISAIFSNYGFVKCILGTNGRGEGVITILSYILAFMISTRAFSSEKNILKLIIITMMIASIYGIVQANIPNGVKLFFGNAASSGTAKATFGNQNFFSSFLCLVLPMTCYFFINTDKKSSWIYFGCAIIGFAGLIYSKTLGGYLTFSGMFILICIFSLIFTKSRKKVLLKSSLLLILFVLLFLGLSYTKQDTYISELKNTTTEVKKLATNDKNFGTGRMEIWQKTLMVINNKKLFGVGPDSLKYELNNNKYITNGSEDILNKYIIDKAHSEVLHIAATTGIISASLYVIFVVTYMFSLSKIVINKNKEKDSCEYEKQYVTMILIGVLGYLIQSLINISVVQVAPMFWVILGLGNGTIINEKKKISTR